MCRLYNLYDSFRFIVVMQYLHILVHIKRHTIPLAEVMPFLKRITGIGPATPAWEANVLPLNYIRIYS